MSDFRMPDINHVFLVGRLTRDPELRRIPSGTAVCTLRIAVSRFFKNQDGERQEETMFIDVETWDRQAEIVADRLSKGRPVFVEGSLKQDSWEDKATGQTRSRLKVRARPFGVQELDWDEQRRPADGPDQDAAFEESAPEDDIPF